jgi:hypothetical protein
MQKRLSIGTGIASGKEIVAKDLHHMGTIIPFLRDQAVFEPDVTRAMSSAFDEVCHALNLSDGDTRGREAVAVRLIELARRGERDATALRQRVLREAEAG